jgi:hypothetical protein
VAVDVHHLTASSNGGNLVNLYQKKFHPRKVITPQGEIQGGLFFGSKFSAKFGADSSNLGSYT